MTYPTTPEAARLLSFIATTTANDGICPSYAEMADHLGLKSKSGIHRMIVQLEERGHIRRLPYRDRAVEVVNRPTVGLPDDLYRALAKAAPSEGLTIEGAVADAVRCWLDTD